MKKKKRTKEKTVPDSFKQASRYGTYEIQGTNGTENRYPAIGQK